MLRSAKKLQIDHDKIHSREGVLMAPIIELDGLIIRADKPIPAKYAEFFAAHGVHVECIKYKFDLYIKITGTYHLNRQEIKVFLDENKEIIDDYTKGLDEEVTAEVLFKDIDERIKEILEGMKSYICGDSITSSEDFVWNCNEGIKNFGKVVSIKNIEISGLSHSFIGEVIRKFNNGIPFGILAEAVSLKQGVFYGKMLAQNARIEAGSTLFFSQRANVSVEEESSIDFQLDDDVYWCNGSYPMQQTFKEKPKL